jgi:CRP-like cAMP-binding protein
LFNFGLCVLGDIGSLHDSMIAATTLEPTMCLFDHQPYSEVRFDATTMTARDALRNSYLANGFTEEQVDVVNAIAILKSFEDGEEIMGLDDNSKDLMILAEGAADILTITDEPIGVVRPGMPMGEISFLDDRPRSARVISTGPSKVVVLPYEELRPLLTTHPELALRALLNLSRVLCQRIRSANRNLEALMALEESRKG